MRTLASSKPLPVVTSDAASASDPSRILASTLRQPGRWTETSAAQSCIHGESGFVDPIPLNIRVDES